jgi:8-oxo-dGTP diphosphatase
MEDKFDYRVSVKGVIINEEGKIFLVKEDNGDWDIPGGSMEHGENFHQTLKREIMEEMGVEIEVLDKEPFAVWPGQDRKGGWRIIVCFRIKLLSDQLVHSDEFVEYAYCNKIDAEKINLHSLKKPIFNYIK